MPFTNDENRSNDYEGEGPYGEGYTPENYSSVPAPAITSGDSLNPQFAVWALNNEPELLEFVNNLRGLKAEVNPKTKELDWVKHPGAEPLVNEVGAANIYRFLRGFTSKLITLSNIPEYQLLKDLKANAMDFSEFLFINYKKFDLKPEHYSFVCLEGVNFIEMSLYKACKGNTMDFVHPRWRGIETRVTQEMKTSKPKGFWNKFGFD